MSNLLQQYEAYKAKKLKLDISRGKPSPEQLDLTNGMLKIDGYLTENGTDCRNYGLLDGIPEAKRLFGDMLGANPENTIVCGCSSLQIMYFLISFAFTHGVLDGQPWSKREKIKFLCPSPGYDRHFAICEFFGIEMLTVAMNENGPDMDEVERLTKDESVKGVWCVPQYSNPGGTVYSDEVVKRFAALKPAAQDFRIFWDNAYCLHHLTDSPKTIINLLSECEMAGNPNLPYVFGSTSKISFSGAGVGAVAMSAENFKSVCKALSISIIGYDKINQLRHVKFFKDLDGIKAHMGLHKAIIKPKFDVVEEVLTRELGDIKGKDNGFPSWTKPDGGYFVSFDSVPGTAKRVYQLAKDAGVVMTNAGASFPYGKDPFDSNIRISPTFPPLDELKQAMELFALCVRIAINN